MLRIGTRSRRLSLIAVAALAGTALGACGSSSGGASRAPGIAGAAFPVTVENCGSRLTFDKAPTRAVANDINSAEDMLALGLAPSMVGTFGVSGDGIVPARYRAAFTSVRDVSPDYFTLEPLVGLRPDFVFAGWNYGFQQGTSLTPAGLAKRQIKSLALTESCAHVQPGKKQVSIDNTYQDISNLGAVFGVAQRAKELVAKMRAQVAAVQARVAGRKPVSVFLYDSGTSAPFTAPGLATPNALIALAGGTNIFAALKQSWTSVSWEQVVARKPQCIVINDYGTPTWQQKERFLKTSAVSRNLPAVRNGCIAHLSYDELTPSPRNAEAVAAIARLLHPAG